MQYIIAFKSTNLAISGEQRLLACGFMAGVMPLPPQISAGCGICLRLEPDGIGRALRALGQTHAGGYALYTRVRDGNSYIYTEIDEKRLAEL